MLADSVLWRVERHGLLDSTQDRLRRYLDRGRNVHGLAVLAEQQTVGRGRLGRFWQSPRGGSYQSFAVRVSGDVELALIPIVVGVVLAEALAVEGMPVKVKWPNDLFLRGRKLAGILCELHRGHLIIGVGVNVGDSGPTGSSSLAVLDLDSVHGLVQISVGRALVRLRELEGRGLPEFFAPYDLLTGRVVRVRAGECEVTGRAMGIDGSGCLRLCDLGGGCQRICGGSVIAW